MLGDKCLYSVSNPTSSTLTFFEVYFLPQLGSQLLGNKSYMPYKYFIPGLFLAKFTAHSNMVDMFTNI